MIAEIPPEFIINQKKKKQRGGKRKGAGRKPLPDNLKKKPRYLTDEQMKLITKP